jgi:ATP-dependent exoDNAse (exonuclease V) beta subunit
MATPADQRLLELLDKWLTSLELHTKYAALDDAGYSKMQPWPEHQRPSRWIIDLAKQRTLALQSQLQERIKTGDTKFSDSLELMIFLANLVGSQHIQRFIPLAEPASESSVGSDSTVMQAIATREPAPANAATGTREMPKFVVGQSRAPIPATTERVTRTERQSAPPQPAAKAAAKPKSDPAVKAAVKPAKAATGSAAAAGAAAAGAAVTAGTPAAYEQNGPTEEARQQVIADAARLVQWGRKWYELAELIAGMSDRPHVTDVRRILKDNKELIDKKAGRT